MPETVDKVDISRKVRFMKVATLVGCVSTGIMAYKCTLSNSWFSYIPATVLGVTSIVSGDASYGLFAVEDNMHTTLYKNLPWNNFMMKRMFVESFQRTLIWSSIIPEIV